MRIALGVIKTPKNTKTAARSWTNLTISILLLFSSSLGPTLRTNRRPHLSTVSPSDFSQHPGFDTPNRSAFQNAQKNFFGNLSLRYRIKPVCQPTKIRPGCVFHKSFILRYLSDANSWKYPNGLGTGLTLVSAKTQPDKLSPPGQSEDLIQCRLRQ